MGSTTIFVASVLVAIANAQTILTSSAASVAASSTVSQVMPPQATSIFNPGNVSSTDAFNWCLAQQHTCPLICGGAASTNQCNSGSFTYSCICTNGTVPDCTAYGQTLPYFICEATFGQCIASHPDDSVGQGTCMDNHKCGTRNATAEALAAASASSSPTSSAASSSGSSTGSATGSSASSSSSSAGNIATANSQQFATGAFAALLLAAFKLFV